MYFNYFCCTFKLLTIYLVLLRVSRKQFTWYFWGFPENNLPGTFKGFHETIYLVLMRVSRKQFTWYYWGFPGNNLRGTFNSFQETIYLVLLTVSRKKPIEIHSTFIGGGQIWWFCICLVFGFGLSEVVLLSVDGIY